MKINQVFKVVGCDNEFLDTFGKIIGETFCFCEDIGKGRFIALSTKDNEEWIFPPSGVYFEEII